MPEVSTVPDVTEAPETTEVPEITEIPKITEAPEEQYAEPQTYEYQDGRVIINVTVPVGVKLPVDVQLQVNPVPEGSVEYENAAAAVEGAVPEKKFAEHVFYDICFVADGKKVEPEGGEVQVSMRFLDAVLGAGEKAPEISSEDVVVSHISEDLAIEQVTAEVQHTEREVTAVEFAADSFSIYGVSLLNTEQAADGIFNDLGCAVLKLDEEVTMEVTGPWAYFPEGSKVTATRLDLSFPMKAAHGELVNGVGYEISIMNPSGNLISNPAAFFSVSVKTTGSFGVNNSGQEIKVITTKDLPKTNLDVASGSYTDTEITANGLPANGEPVKVIAGSWDYTGDTFLSTGGSYSLGHILSNYNVFVENNFTGTHVVGPMIVGGTASASLGGSTTSATYSHNVPDYFGGVGGNTTITTVSDIPVYLGTGENGKSFVLMDGTGQQYFDYYFTDDFVDFSAAMAALRGEASSFSGVSVNLKNTAKTDGYEVKDNTVKLDVGGSYEFTAAQLASISVLDIQGNFGGGQDTFIIVKDGGAVNLPKTMNNGNELGSIEAGATGSVVFLVPNASSVTGNAISGHVVAPVADVKLSGGYFNGCVIAKNFVAEAEGHMWNYNGTTLTPVSAELQASKWVDDEIPGSDEKFRFTLEELVSTDNGANWNQIQEVSNNGSAINFKKISYAGAGTHWYRISEAGEKEGYTMDSCQYVVQVAVSVSGSQVVTTPKYYIAKADQEVLNADGTINMDALNEFEIQSSQMAFTR